MRPSLHTEANARRREFDHWKAIYEERDAVSKLSSKNEKLQQKVNTEKKGKRQLNLEYNAAAKVAKTDTEAQEENLPRT